MRLKKGDKVEVLNQKEVTSGAWQCAVIVSGNGRFYCVRYDWSSSVGGEVFVERVPRKSIRPCPPPVRGADSWKVGDVVEVYDVGFWKMAKVVKACDENYYLAKVFGSLEELRTHKFSIRVRQVWKDDKWTVIGKVNLRLPLSGNGFLPSLENCSCQDSYIVLPTSSKRACPYTEVYPWKRRVIEKECEQQQILYRSPSSLLKKVDALAYPIAKHDAKYMPASILCPTTRDIQKKNIIFPGANTNCVRSSDASSSDSDACSVESVGSCSVNGNFSSKKAGYDLAGNCKDVDTLSSDADSFSSSTDLVETVSLPPPKHDMATSIHRLELDAYRRTLTVMHASGSLSWEQQDFLTRLRMSLRISNDEHLMEGQGWRLLALLPKEALKLFSLVLRCWSGGTVDTSYTKADENFEKRPTLGYYGVPKGRGDTPNIAALKNTSRLTRFNSLLNSQDVGVKKSVYQTSVSIIDPNIEAAKDSRILALHDVN